MASASRTQIHPLFPRPPSHFHHCFVSVFGAQCCSAPFRKMTGAGGTVPGQSASEQGKRTRTAAEVRAELDERGYTVHGRCRLATECTRLHGCLLTSTAGVHLPTPTVERQERQEEQAAKKAKEEELQAARLTYEKLLAESESKRGTASSGGAAAPPAKGAALAGPAKKGSAIASGPANPGSRKAAQAGSSRGHAQRPAASREDADADRTETDELHATKSRSVRRTAEIEEARRELMLKSLKGVWDPDNAEMVEFFEQMNSTWGSTIASAKACCPPKDLEGMSDWQLQMLEALVKVEKASPKKRWPELDAELEKRNLVKMPAPARRKAAKAGQAGPDEQGSHRTAKGRRCAWAGGRGATCLCSGCWATCPPGPGSVMFAGAGVACRCCSPVLMAGVVGR